MLRNKIQPCCQDNQNNWRPSGGPFDKGPISILLQIKMLFFIFCNSKKQKSPQQNKGPSADGIEPLTIGS